MTGKIEVGGSAWDFVSGLRRELVVKEDSKILSKTSGGRENRHRQCGGGWRKGRRCWARSWWEVGLLLVVSEWLVRGLGEVCLGFWVFVLTSKFLDCGAGRLGEDRNVLYSIFECEKSRAAFGRAAFVRLLSWGGTPRLPF